MDLKVVNRLAELMARHGLTEVEISEQDSRIRVVRPAGTASEVSLQSSTGIAPMTNDIEPEPEVESRYVTSPMPGTFYLSPSPDAAQFVSVGDVIKPGKVVGIVEAMKVMNEVKAEISGTVTKVLVANGAPVEFGQKLFEIQ